MKLFNKLNLTLIAIVILAVGISSANAILPTNEDDFVTQETIITADWLNHVQNYVATNTTPFFNILGDTLDDIPDGTTYKLLTATKDGYIDQDVSIGSSPTFLTPTISGLVWDGVTLASSSDLMALWSTTNLTEGTNLYYTDARADARIMATSTIPNITTLANLTDIGTISQLDFTNASGTLLTVTTLYGNIIGNVTGDITGNVTGVASGNDVLGQATSTLASHTTTYNHANYDTAYGWGDHAGIYDILGQATSTLSSHTTTYNHDNFLTGNQTITLSGDISGSGETAITTTIGADKILESHLKAVNSATDEYCLTYESTTGDFEWEECASGGGSGTVNAGTTGQLAYYAGDGSIVSGTSSVKVLYYLGDPYLISEVETIINSRLSASGDIYTSGNLGTEDYLKFDTSGRGIIDQSSNEQLFFLWTQFAENYFTIQNAATGNNPTLTATGSDANVGLTIDTKGTGLINFYGDYTFPQSDGDANQVLATNGSGALGWTSVSNFSSIAGLNALLSGEEVASTSVATLSSLTSIGTIGTGVWEATDIGVAYGGTGVSSLTDHGVLVGSGASALTALSVGTDGQLLIGSTGADPVFATLNADRSLTATAGAGTLEIDADAELYTKAFQFVVGSSTMSTTTATQSFQVPNAITITNVYGWCNSGTTTIQLDERAATTPKTAGTDILSSALAIGDYATTASFDNAGIAAGAYINLDIDGYFVGSPTQCNVNIKYTIDD